MNDEEIEEMTAKLEYNASEGKPLHIMEEDTFINIIIQYDVLNELNTAIKWMNEYKIKQKKNMNDNDNKLIEKQIFVFLTLNESEQCVLNDDIFQKLNEFFLSLVNVKYIEMKLKGTVETGEDCDGKYNNYISIDYWSQIFDNLLSMITSNKHKINSIYFDLEDFEQEHYVYFNKFLCDLLLLNDKIHLNDNIETYTMKLILWFDARWIKFWLKYPDYFNDLKNAFKHSTSLGALDLTFIGQDKIMKAIGGMDAYHVFNEFFGKTCLAANKSMVEMTLYIYLESYRFESDWFQRHKNLSAKLQIGLEQYFKYKQVKHEFVKNEKKKYYVEGDVFSDHNKNEKRFAFILRSNNSVCFDFEGVFKNIIFENDGIDLYQWSVSRAVKWNLESVKLLTDYILNKYEINKIQLHDAMDIAYSVMDHESLKYLCSAICDRSELKYNVLSNLYINNISATDDIDDDDDGDSVDKLDKTEIVKNNNKNIECLCDLIVNCSSYLNLLQFGFKNYEIEISKIKLLIDAYFEHLLKLYRYQMQIGDVICNVIKKRYNLFVDRNVIDQICDFSKIECFCICILNELTEEIRNDLVNYYIMKTEEFNKKCIEQSKDESDNNKQLIISTFDTYLNGKLFDGDNKVAFIINDVPLHQT